MSSVTWKPSQSILSARNLAHLVAYLQENDALLVSQPHLYDARRVNDALFALDEATRNDAARMAQMALPAGNISFAHGSRYGTYLLVLKYPAHKLAVFLTLTERRESVLTTAAAHRPEQFLQVQDATMGMMPAALMNSHEVAQVARNSVRVHMGFAGAYEEIQTAVAIQARRCLDAGITMFASVGHGFGGAIASLMAVHLNVVARERLAPSAAVVPAAVAGAVASTAAAVTEAALSSATAAAEVAASEVTLAISDVASGVLGAVNAVTPGKQMSVARKQMGTTAIPSHYFMNPLFSAASVRLVTFGALASGNTRWCDMVSVATLGDWERYVMSNDPMVALPSSPTLLGRYAQPQTHVMTLPFVSTRTELHPVITQVSEAVAAEQQAAVALLSAPAAVDATAPATAAVDATAPATAAVDAPAAAAVDATAPATAPAPSLVGTFALSVLAVTTAFANVWHGTVVYAVERNPIVQWKQASDARSGLMLGTLRAPQVAGNTIAHYEAGLALYA